MVDLYYGATMDIAIARSRIANPPANYTFTHFLFLHIGIGDGNSYLRCIPIYAFGTQRMYGQLDLTSINSNPWSNTGTPLSAFVLGNQIMDLAAFNILCPSNVLSKVITITPVGLYFEPLVRVNRLGYQAQTTLPGASEGEFVEVTQNLNPSPPYHG